MEAIDVEENDTANESLSSPPNCSDDRPPHERLLSPVSIWEVDLRRGAHSRDGERCRQPGKGELEPHETSRRAHSSDS